MMRRSTERCKTNAKLVRKKYERYGRDVKKMQKRYMVDAGEMRERCEVWKKYRK